MSHGNTTCEFVTVISIFIIYFIAINMLINIKIGVMHFCHLIVPIATSNF